MMFNATPSLQNQPAEQEGGTGQQMHEVVHAFISKMPSDETIAFGMNPRKPTRTKTKPNVIQMFLLSA
jgi:hypothetical protein